MNEEKQLTHFQMMLPIERQLLVGKIVDLLIHQPDFCTDMIAVVKLKEEAGLIKGKFLETENLKA